MDRRCVRDDFIRRLSIVGSRVQVVAAGITRNDDDDMRIAAIDGAHRVVRR